MKRSDSLYNQLFVVLRSLFFLCLPCALLFGDERSSTAATLSKVDVAPDRRGFIRETGKRFVPFGVTYYQPGTGWAPQLWKQFDAEATRKDLMRLHEFGGNCVRVFLSFGSFYATPGQLSREGLDKFEQFLKLAEEAGLYVQPTGPDHWEGLPLWAQGDRLADDKILTALEQFWRFFAARYRNRNVIFAYELLNEPEVAWDTPTMRDKWKAWLITKYGVPANLQQAWNKPAGTNQADWPLPPSKNTAAGKELLDYQHFREELAEQWTRRQVKAIKSADPQALVTVGLIQWSVPLCLAGSFQYSGFRPEQQADLLDFLEVHFYPLAGGFYEYETEESEVRNLAYLERVVNEVARWGKPTVLGEFGWYGGGKLSIAGEHRPATEQQQARWCRLAVETTAGKVCGWLNWGFHDDPDATDVSQLTGLLTEQGKEKAWGRVFRELAKRYAHQSMPSVDAGTRPNLDWDLNLTQKKARDDFLRNYIEAFKNQSNGSK
jgi:hypothetical protein